MHMTGDQTEKALDMHNRPGVYVCAHEYQVADAGDTIIVRVAGHLMTEHGVGHGVGAMTDSDVFVADIVMPLSAFFDFAEVTARASVELANTQRWRRLQ